MNKHVVTKIDDAQRQKCCRVGLDVLHQLIVQQQAIEQLRNPKDLQKTLDTIGVRIAMTRNSIVRELQDKIGDKPRSAGSFAAFMQLKAVEESRESLEKLETDIPALKAIASAPIAEAYRYKAERVLQ